MTTTNSTNLKFDPEDLSSPNISNADNISFSSSTPVKSKYSSNTNKKNFETIILQLNDNKPAQPKTPSTPPPRSSYSHLSNKSKPNFGLSKTKKYDPQKDFKIEYDQSKTPIQPLLKNEESTQQKRRRRNLSLETLTSTGSNPINELVSLFDDTNQTIFFDLNLTPIQKAQNSKLSDEYVFDNDKNTHKRKNFLRTSGTLNDLFNKHFSNFAKRTKNNEKKTKNLILHNFCTSPNKQNPLKSILKLILSSLYDQNTDLSSEKTLLSECQFSSLIQSTSHSQDQDQEAQEEKINLKDLLSNIDQPNFTNSLKQINLNRKDFLTNAFQKKFTMLSLESPFESILMALDVVFQRIENFEKIQKEKCCSYRIFVLSTGVSMIFLLDYSSFFDGSEGKNGLKSFYEFGRCLHTLSLTNLKPNEKNFSCLANFVFGLTQQALFSKTSHDFHSILMPNIDVNSQTTNSTALMLRIIHEFQTGFVFRNSDAEEDQSFDEQWKNFIERDKYSQQQKTLKQSKSSNNIDNNTNNAFLSTHKTQTHSSSNYSIPFKTTPRSKSLESMFKSSSKACRRRLNYNLLDEPISKPLYKRQRRSSLDETVLISPSLPIISTHSTKKVFYSMLEAQKRGLGERNVGHELKEEMNKGLECVSKDFEEYKRKRDFEVHILTRSIERLESLLKNSQTQIQKSNDETCENLLKLSECLISQYKSSVRDLSRRHLQTDEYQKFCLSLNRIKIRVFESLVKKYEERNIKLSEKLETTQQNFNQQNSNFQQKENEFKVENEKVKQEIGKLSEKLKKIDEEKVDLCQRLIVEVGEKNLLKESLSKLEDEINTLKRQKHQSEQENLNLKAEKQSLENEISTLRTQNNKYSAENEKLLESMKNKEKEFFSKTTEQNDELQRLRLDLSKTKSKLDALMQISDRQTSFEVKEVKQQVQTLNEQLASSKLEVYRLKGENADLNEEKKQVQKDLEKCRKQLEKSENERQKSDFQAKIGENKRDLLQNQISELRSQLSSSRTQLESKSEKIKQVDKEKFKLELEYQNTQGQIQYLNTELNSLRQELELQQKLMKTNEENQDRESKQNQLTFQRQSSTQHRSIEQLEARLKSKSESLFETKNRLNQVLNDEKRANEQLSELRLTCSDLERQLSNLKSSLEERENEIHSILSKASAPGSSEISKENSRLTREIKKLRDETQNFRHTIKEKQKRIDLLTEKSHKQILNQSNYDEQLASLRQKLDEKRMEFEEYVQSQKHEQQDHNISIEDLKRKLRLKNDELVRAQHRIEQENKNRKKKDVDFDGKFGEIELRHRELVEKNDEQRETINELTNKLNAKEKVVQDFIERKSNQSSKIDSLIGTIASSTRRTSEEYRNIFSRVEDSVDKTIDVNKIASPAKFNKTSQSVGRKLKSVDNNIGKKNGGNSQHKKQLTVDTNRIDLTETVSNFYTNQKHKNHSSSSNLSNNTKKLGESTRSKRSSKRVDYSGFYALSQDNDSDFDIENEEKDSKTSSSSFVQSKKLSNKPKRKKSSLENSEIQDNVSIINNEPLSGSSKENHLEINLENSDSKLKKKDSKKNKTQSSSKKQSNRRNKNKNITPLSLVNDDNNEDYDVDQVFETNKDNKMKKLASKFSFDKFEDVDNFPRLRDRLLQ